MNKKESSDKRQHQQMSDNQNNYKHRHHHSSNFRKAIFIIFLIIIVVMAIIYFVNPQLFEQILSKHQEYYEQQTDSISYTTTTTSNIEVEKTEKNTKIPPSTTTTTKTKTTSGTKTTSQKQTNKEKSKSTSSSSTTAQNDYSSSTTSKSDYSTTTTEYNNNYTQTTTEIPQPCSVGENQIVSHIAYKLSYNDKYEQADWVYYLLTKARINGGEERTGDFCEDKSVESQTAYKSDYSNSGYDRGHLCPSADVRDDLEAQKETFYMSNMSPQVPEFNRGIWKDLEEQVRRWAQKHDSIYIVTGPILKGKMKKIGYQTKVSVPNYYYKILYSPRDKGHLIAFLLPNKNCKGVPNDYIVSVDSVESFSGLKFFPKIKNEKSLKKKVDDASWWKN